MTDRSERDALDAQYDNRARVPDFQEHVDRFTAESAALREEADCRLDLAYGGGPNQGIDLFLPAGRRGAPLLVFIHGGYWQSRDRKDFSFVARPFLDSGIAVALIGYDLAPAVRVEEITEQVRDALVWLHGNAPDHGCDAGRLTVTGHSAGGHLTAMALATDWTARGAPAGLIAAAAPISGLFDLEPIRRCYLNDVLGLDADEAARQSPVRLGAPVGARMMVTVGGDESEAFLDQSAAYTAHLRDAGLEVVHEVQPDLDHFTVVGALADPTNAVTRWLIDATLAH